MPIEALNVNVGDPVYTIDHDVPYQGGPVEMIHRHTVLAISGGEARAIAVRRSSGPSRRPIYDARRFYATWEDARAAILRRMERRIDDAARDLDRARIRLDLCREIPEHEPPHEPETS